jgi:peroxiredoxin
MGGRIELTERKNLKLKYVVTYLLVFSCLAACAQPKLPDLTIADMKGNRVNTRSELLKNGPSLLVFWTITCHNMIDGLVEIEDEYYDDWKKDYGLSIIGISVDDSRNSPKVQPFVNGKGWDYQIYSDANGDLMRAMNVTQHPHLFLIDKDGNILWQKSSFLKGDEITISEALEEHL